jgi:hypothetical protein
MPYSSVYTGLQDLFFRMYQGSSIYQVEVATVCNTVALTKVKVLQRGVATQVGDAAGCHTVAPTKFDMLQRGKATQVGDAAACHTSAPRQVKVL